MVGSGQVQVEVMALLSAAISTDSGAQHTRKQVEGGGDKPTSRSGVDVVGQDAAAHTAHHGATELCHVFQKS